MKLLLLNYEYPPLGGGGGYSSQQLAQALARQFGYKVTVLTAGVSNRETTEIDEYGVKIIRLPISENRAHRSSASFSFMFKYVAKSIYYIWKNRAYLRETTDVIYTHFAIPTGPAGVVAKIILGKPNILQLHGGEILSQPLELDGYKNPIINFVVKYVIHDADYVLANSNDTAFKAKEYLSIKCPIHVLTLGYARPNDKLLAQIKQYEGKRHDDGVIRFVMVSRLVPRKALEYLLEAFAQLSDAPAELHLVGDGPETDRLCFLTDSLGLKSRVFFHGFVTEERKFELLYKSDVFILPTLHEGLGLVYYEAMYCGLPIITTNNGGQTDFLSSENAILVNIRDVNALVYAIKQAIESSDWRYRCGNANKIKIETLYVSHIIGGYHEVFQKFLI